MTQKLKCPHCAGEVTLEQLIQTADLEALSKAQAAFGEDWPLILEYLNRHRPPSGRSIDVKRQVRLTRDVWKMWHSGRFQFRRQEYRVGREEFRQALCIVCDQVPLGLTNHNYLIKVLISMAEKTSQREERELRQREGDLMAGERPAGGPGSASPLPNDPEWLKKHAELGKAVRLAKTPEAKATAKKTYEEHLKRGGHGTQTD